MEKNLNFNLTQQIKRLNKMVVEDSVQEYYLVSTFLQYKKDVSTIQLPMDRPKYASMAGTKGGMFPPLI